MSEMFTPTPDVPNQQDTKVKEKADAVTVAIALSKQWEQEKIEAEREMYKEGGFRVTPDMEQNTLKYAERLVIHEDDEMVAEKVGVVNSPYEIEHKKALLSIIRDLEEQKSLPLAVKKEAIALLVPYSVGMPELIKAYKHLVWEFVSHEADDEILYYAFHRAWESVEDLNTATQAPTNYIGDLIERDTGGYQAFLAGEKFYMGENLMYEIEIGLRDALNFEDENQYAQTAAFLEFLKDVMDRGASQLLFVTLKSILEKKSKNDSGMLLKLRAQEILAGSDDSGFQAELRSGEVLSRTDINDDITGEESFLCTMVARLRQSRETACMFRIQ